MPGLSHARGYPNGLQLSEQFVLREQRQTSGADSRGTREQGVEESGPGQVHRPQDRM